MSEMAMKIAKEMLAVARQPSATAKGCTDAAAQYSIPAWLPRPFRQMANSRPLATHRQQAERQTAAITEGLGKLHPMINQ
jgi:hypothetical protein